MSADPWVETVLERCQTYPAWRCPFCASEPMSLDLIRLGKRVESWVSVALAVGCGCGYVGMYVPRDRP